MNAQELITEHLDIWTTAQEPRKTGGRGRGKKTNDQSLYGIKKLRELILDLAVRGKLVAQNPADEPASVLLEKIAAEKARLIKEKKIKKQKKLPEITEDEKPFALPEGWEWVRLGDLGYTQTGGTPSKTNSSFFGNDVPFIKPGDIYPSHVDYTNEGLSFEGQKELGRTAPAESILMVCIGTIGKCNAVNRDCTFNQQINSITPYKNVSKYLLVSLCSDFFQTIAWERSSSTTIAILNKGKWSGIAIPLPPLPEQHRIVTKVDELMALCDQLEQQQTTSNATHQTLLETLLATLISSADHEAFTTAWERIATHFDILFTTEQSIDQLKQTILQLAVMGKLVPQSPEDEPASVLLEKIAKEKARLLKEGKIKKQKKLPEITEEEKPFALPEGWEWARVWYIAKLITSGSRDWAKYYSDSGAVFVTMGNLSRGSYELRLENLRYVNPPKDGEGSRTKLEANDLLISITGDVGNLGLIPENFGEAYINQHTCLLRFMPKCQNRFFPELLLSPFTKNQFDAPQRGIKNSFRLSDVGEMIIPLPPLAEQHRIVAKIDELMSLCNQLKTYLHENQTTKLQLADTIVKQAVA